MTNVNLRYLRIYDLRYYVNLRFTQSLSYNTRGFHTLLPCTVMADSMADLKLFTLEMNGQTINLSGIFFIFFFCLAACIATQCTVHTPVVRDTKSVAIEEKNY